MSGRELNYEDFDKLNSITTVGSGDKIPLYDSSADEVKQFPATDILEASKATSVTAATSVTMADATSLTSVISLANENKSKLNALITKFNSLLTNLGTAKIVG